MTPSINGVGQPAAAAGKPEPARLKETVQQFEALLIADLLRSMHETGASGWLGGEKDAAAEPTLGMAEEHFARALASRGGLGLASLIERGLEEKR